MNTNQIFWPVLAQILLTLVMYIVLGIRKAKAVTAGTVNRQLTALDNRIWPEEVVKVSNNIANQFEGPVLFYVLCLVIYSTNLVGLAFLALAWLYVLSRYAHAYVHTGSNSLPLRLRLFLIGCLALLTMLFLLAWKLASGVTA